MSYRDSHGRDGWQTDTNSIDSSAFDMMPAQAPQHPIPTMQGAFEESIMETLQDVDNTVKDYAKADAQSRRRMLLEAPNYQRTVAGRWKQKRGENFHPLWKLVAQISFGMHLLHQGLAKSDEEVIKILQTHVDEIDGFLERTTEDFEVAQRDITERIRYLKLPLDHGDVFDNMLMDRKFRNAILDGNDKIEHIVDRTSVSLRDTLKDVKKGFDGTRELARYFRKLDKSWQNQTEEHMGVYAAMMGNTEGWTAAYVEIQNQGNVLHDSLTELSTIIAEIQRRVGIASRKDPPNVSSSRASSQVPSRVSSIYSTSNAAMQKPHIANELGTGNRRQGSTTQLVNERTNQEKKAYTGDRYRNQPTESGSQTHSRRGSDESGSRRISFSEFSQPQPQPETNKRSSGSWKRHSKGLDGYKTSWFRKSSSESPSVSDKDNPRLASNSSFGKSAISTETADAPRSNPIMAQAMTSREATQPAAVLSTKSMPRKNDSAASLSRWSVRESVADNVLEEVTEEDEVPSEEEADVEIVQATPMDPSGKIASIREVTVASNASSPSTTQKPVLRDLPLRDYTPSEPVPNGPPRVDLDNVPKFAETMASLKRASTFHAGTAHSPTAADSQRTSELRPEPLRVARVSSFEALDNRSSTASGPQSAKAQATAKRPANLKLFPTIAVSPGPQTAPLASTKPLYSPALGPSPRPDDEKESHSSDKFNPPRTPAERGRSPPPPERVPTPPRVHRAVSPSLQGLVSATVSGPEPDYYPYNLEEGELSQPLVAELGDGRRTADGSRAPTPEHAELGADSPAAKTSSRPVHSPFIDPIQQREEAEARKRDRELHEEEEKKKVQAQIMSRVAQKTSAGQSSESQRNPTRNTTKLREPPQVSPPANGNASMPKQAGPPSVPLEQAMTSPNYNLPFSKHNRTSSRDIKSLLKRFFRIGRDKDRAGSLLSSSTEPADFQRPPRERKAFGISLPFKLGSRRKKSQQQQLNMQGGLQPFGVWSNTAQGMSWSDTRRGSMGHGGDLGADTDTDDASGDNTDISDNFQSPDKIPGAQPRPEQGTMSIPGVGSIDWNRASTHFKVQKQRELEVQNLLQKHNPSAIEQVAAPPVPQVPSEHAIAATQDNYESEPEDPNDYTDAEEEEEREAEADAYSGQHMQPIVDDVVNEDNGVVKVDSDSVPQDAEDATGADSDTEGIQGVSRAARKPGDSTEHASEQSSHRSSPKRIEDQRELGQFERSQASRQSETSPITRDTASLATSSLLARKSDATETPTTSLSLQFSSPLTSEIFAAGSTHFIDSDAKKKAHTSIGSVTSATSNRDASAGSPREDSSAHTSLARAISTSAAPGAARSPALGADQVIDPLDRAGHQIIQPHSPHTHGRESLGISEGLSSAAHRESVGSPAPRRTSSLGHLLALDGSNHDEDNDLEGQQPGDGVGYDAAPVAGDFGDAQQTEGDEGDAPTQGAADEDEPEPNDQPTEVVEDHKAQDVTANAQEADSAAEEEDHVETDVPEVDDKDEVADAEAQADDVQPDNDATSQDAHADDNTSLPDPEEEQEPSVAAEDAEQDGTEGNGTPF